MYNCDEKYTDGDTLMMIASGNVAMQSALFVLASVTSLLDREFYPFSHNILRLTEFVAVIIMLQYI